ncbi:uncharacterized protein TNCV_4473421 [Trichonephila clavipes]|uniref:Uncharacterized protein n=1 Tax=Trichonephila clavipes TaxID=2585209 RepID=A0A8X6VG18_TRICX|nr:uncharacterized protein TNCV_4473421 [Trichonephila clavipes]
MSRSVVQRLWDQYQSEDSVSEDPALSRPTRATTPAEDRFLALSARKRRRTTTVPQLVADHFQASGRRISATTVPRNRHQCTMQVCITKTSCVRSPQRTTAKETAYAGQENMFLGHATTMGFCAVHRRVQIYNGFRASTDLEEQRTECHQSTLLKGTFQL